MSVIDPNQSADRLINLTAGVSDGYKARTVRVADGKYPLCTSTYNYCQDEETKAEIARRIAALWNLAAGIPTHELEALDASGFKLRKKG
ncbi:TPA: hypothetical protein L5A09_006697 [Pseudomonas aeruginosa]|nr:hypothetical protein [Pseudomonas aeruginosa]